MINITFVHSEYSRISPTLPQHDSPVEQQNREIQLAKSKMQYIWDFEAPAVQGIPKAKMISEANKPTMA